MHGEPEVVARVSTFEKASGIPMDGWYENGEQLGNCSAGGGGLTKWIYASINLEKKTKGT
jgi:hypothetical protein